MNPKRKKIVLLASTGLLLLAFAASVSWHAIAWSEEGWTGMMFMWVVKVKTEGGEKLKLPVSQSRTVSMIAPESPADKVGIQPGDEVLEINGISTYETTRLKELAAGARVGDTLTYRIRRGEREFSIPLGLETPLKSKQMVISLSTSILVALISLAIGSFVYWKRIEDRRAFIFYLMSIAAASYCLILGFTHDPGLAPMDLGSLLTVRDIVMTGVLLVSSVILAPLFLHFALVFPKARPVVKNHPYIFRWIYGLPVLLQILGFTLGFTLGFLLAPSKEARLAIILPVVITLLALTIFLFSRWRKAVRAEGWKQWLISRPFTGMLAYILITSLVTGISLALIEILHLSKILGLILLILPVGLPNLVLVLAVSFYPVATCVALLLSYRESGVEEKRQVRWPLWGTIVALAGFFAISILNLGLYILLGFNRVLTSLMVTMGISKAFFLLIPISFAFAILKYRLMDIDLIIKKTILYTLLTGVILVIYLSLVGGLGGVLVTFAGVESQWVTIFSTLTIVAVFVPVRNRVQGFVDRRFFRRKYDYPQALKIINHEISEAVDLQALVKLVSERLQQALQNRAVVIFTKAPRDQTFVATAKVGVPDEILGKLKFNPHSKLLSMMGRVFEVRRKDFPDEEKLKLRKASSVLIVPVNLKSEPIGFISLGSKLSDEEYDVEDTEFLEAVADRMAVGLNNLRLVKQEQELEGAREIQQGLLPQEIPQIRGYEIAGAWQPARVVGGDYFDVLKFSEGRVALCIADVVGKGMPAALLMANLQAAVKAFASDTEPPKELCGKVNRVICSNIAAGKFITFFYCLLEAEARRLIYTSAGHNPPILLRRDGTALRLGEGGAVLGVFQEWNCEQGEVELASGDKLLLYTDGVTEVTNEEDEEFGEERLIEVLAENRGLGAVELQKRVMEAVTEFSDGNFQDDATLIAMSVE